MWTCENVEMWKLRLKCCFHGYCLPINHLEMQKLIFTFSHLHMCKFAFREFNQKTLILYINSLFRWLNFLFLQYEQVPILYRVAFVWSLHRYRRAAGHCYKSYQDMVRLYLFSYHGVPPHHLFHPGIPDEY
jgi:hypothetical protein